MTRIPILIDTDIGSDIDDTWALVYALCREAFDVKGICVTGKLPEYRAAIVTRILRELGREEIPVFAGVTTHGEEIRPQARWTEWVRSGLRQENFHEMFSRLLSETPDLHIVGLAPNSTLAAMQDIILRQNVPVIAMAGSVRKGYFGAPVPVPECNIVTDLPASKKFLGRQMRYCMIPLDACGEIVLTGEDYALLRDSRSAAARVVMENYLVWDADYVGGARKSDPKVSSTILYDLAPLWYLEFPQAFEKVRLPIAVTEEGLTKEQEDGTPMDVAIRICDMQKLLKLTAQTLASGKN